MKNLETSMENSRQKRGSLTPSSMSRTLWSSRDSPIKDLRSSDDLHKFVNVQVVLRCRPPSDDEMKVGTTPLVIVCDELKQEVTASLNTSNKQIDKSFKFDKVFGPESKQNELHDNVVSPIVCEVLEGYNWTIFAYGQTGTGKTYTMEGEARKEKNGEFHKDAGVIPRAVQQIFEILENERVDYNMKVTYLELYNEEVTDLLASDEGLISSPSGEKSRRPLVLMEDGKGAVFVRGLEEEIVCSEDEIYAILAKGSAKKHTADTLLNKQSNRSHSIFSITIEIRESSPDGSELIKCGKLNLVDLAGSENILRSGAREVRAREAGEINKSLLTLGRVINALAENSVHVPYRESKLTRLLRDSLGGKTKACMIATVSPSVLSLEETLSTLDYAFRAKSIKNTPEVNRKVMKSELVKDLYYQINRLKQELRATRETNGVCASPDHQQHEEATKKLMELQELYLHQQQLTVELKEKLEIIQRELTRTRESLTSLDDEYRRIKDSNEEKEKMIVNLLSSGKTLKETALELRTGLEGAISEASTLFTRIEHKDNLEDRNRHHIENFYSQLVQQLEELDKSVSSSISTQQRNFKTIQDDAESFLTSKSGAIDELIKQIEKLKELHKSGMKNMDESAEELYINSQSTLSSLSSEFSTLSSSITDLIEKSSSNANTINNGLKNSLDNLGSRISSFIEQQHENYTRTYQASNSISQSLMSFFKTLNLYISKLTLLEEDSKTITNQKLSAFTKKFEEFSLDEERLLLEKIAELLASSRSRKKNLVEAALDDILESSCKRNANLNQELSNMQKFTFDSEKMWTNHIGKTESNYVEDAAAIEAGKKSLGEGLQCCITKSTEVVDQCKIGEESLLSMIKKHVDVINSSVKGENEENQKLDTRFSSVSASILEETDFSCKHIISSIEGSLRSDHEFSEKVKFVSSRFYDDTKELSSIHSHEVGGISQNARKSLLDDYMVDDMSSLRPRKREFNLPSREYIENIIDDLFEESLKPSEPQV